MYQIDKLVNLQIGVQGENVATDIEVDMTTWAEKYPEALFYVLFKPYNEDYAFPVVSDYDSETHVLTWHITFSVTSIVGVGYTEIRAVDSDVGLVKKTRIIPTVVEHSVSGLGTDDPPEPYEDWVNTVLAAKDTAVDSKEAAEAAQEAAETARDAAQAAAGDFQGLTATANGLAAGSDPTVNVTHSEGGLYNMAFGIPKGEKGETGDPAPSDQVVPAVNSYLSQVITNPDSPPLDRTLTSANAAAPADMVGDLKSAIEYHGESIEADLAVISDNQSNDNLADVSKMTDWPSDNTYATTDFISAKKDDVIYSTRKDGSTYYGLNNVKIYVVDEYDYTLTRLERAVGFTNSYVVQNENTKYVRITVSKSYYNSTGKVWSLTINSYPTTAAGITEYSKSITALDSVARQHASDIENSLAKYVLIKPQDGINKTLGLEISDLNVFNPYADGVVLGKRINGTGRLLTSETWFTSDYIPCAGKSTIYITQLDGNGDFLSIITCNFGHIEQYNASKSLIPNSYEQDAQSINIDENAVYIRFSNVKTQYDGMINGNRLLCVSFDTYPTSKDEIETYYSNIFKSSVDNVPNVVESVISAALPLISPANKLDKNKITPNSALNNSGQTSQADNYFTTDFIPVEQYDIIYMSGIDSNGTYWGHTNYNIFKIVCFAENKTTVTEYSANYRNGYQVTAPGTKYARMTMSNTPLNWVYACITINEKPTRATMIDYAAPYYSSSGVDDDTKRSRKTLWLGTSIPTYGYPQLLGRKAGATVYNEAIGESCIAKGKRSLITTANICGIRKKGGLRSLTQTRAEKETLLANWATIASEIDESSTLTDDEKRICRMSSYEIILDPYLTGEDPTAVTFDASAAYPVGTLVRYDGKLYVLRGEHAAGAAWSWSTSSGAKPLDVPHAQKANLIVLNHGYNDQSGDLLAPENNPYDVYTLEGAYNWIIKHILDLDPTMNVVIFGHYTDFAYPDAEQALVNVSNRWNIPYYKLSADLGWSTQEINTTKKLNANGNWETITATDMQIRNMWLGDGIHPVGEASKKIAEIASHIMDDWIEMYF